MSGQEGASKDPPPFRSVKNAAGPDKNATDSDKKPQAMINVSYMAKMSQALIKMSQIPIKKPQALRFRVCSIFV